MKLVSARYHIQNPEKSNASPFLTLQVKACDHECSEQKLEHLCLQT
jgi:hypothetical protein